MPPKFITQFQKHRAALGVEDKLPQLRLQLNKTGKRAADEMKPVCTPSVDITEMVNESRKLIQGKNPTEALRILANIYPGATSTKIRSSAEQVFTQFHFSSFFGLTMRSRDGRVVAKNPGIAIAKKDLMNMRQKFGMKCSRPIILKLALQFSGEFFQL